VEKKMFHEKIFFHGSRGKKFRRWSKIRAPQMRFV